MKTIQVYDRPMCCSTGVCGPEVDPALAHFAADLEWLKTQGHNVERFNLAQQPQAFIENSAVHQLLSTLGTDCLPLLLIDGQVISGRTYPSREMLTDLVTSAPVADVAEKPRATLANLPVVELAQEPVNELASDAPSGGCGKTKCC